MAVRKECIASHGSCRRTHWLQVDKVVAARQAANVAAGRPPGPRAAHMPFVIQARRCFLCSWFSVYSCPALNATYLECQSDELAVCACKQLPTGTRMRDTSMP